MEVASEADYCETTFCRLGQRMKRLLVGALALLLILFVSEVQAQSDNETCMECHFDPDLTGLDKFDAEISMYVHTASLDSSAHAGMDCVDCHIDLAGFDDYPHEEILAPANCSDCHSDVEEIYSQSVHGLALDKSKAPTCASCHGSHNILTETDTESMVSAKNLPNTCSSCHSKLVRTEDPDIRIADSFDRYMRGIHAEGIAKGIGSAASCNDCHGMHDLQKASDPRSMVNKLNIPRTCAKCHNDISIQYNRGIHGKALAAGVLDSPNCTDCHGEHEILEIDDTDSPVNATNLSEWVCAKCHNDPRINEKFGLASGKFTSYQDSYHGLAVRGGSVKAASCISCHKAHDILPKTNPASSIHPNNLTETCQKCHPDANDAFAASYAHNQAEAEYYRLDHIVKVIYIIVIVLIIGGMIVHNLIIFFRYIIEKHRFNKAQPTVERFSFNMVYQHLVLTVAFIVLVITGFALRYPDEWWVKVLNWFGMYEDTRSVVHRIAAVVLIYISTHHALFLVLTRRGREELKSLAPVKSDLTDVSHNLRYFLGKSKTRPRFDRYDYTEKGEYWALVWGTVIMGLTGFVLWFPTFFTSFLPAWVVQIAETIHLYEAWLATLAIVVFHFFFVMFHPEQYPMSLTWITGKMTLESCQHHHPAWYERISAEEKSKADSTDEQKKDQFTGSDS
jgi:cytochrome b subunit of formate dehydrogenase